MREGQTPAAEPGSAASVPQGALPHTQSSNMCLAVWADSTGTVYVRINGRVSGKDLLFFFFFSFAFPGFVMSC